jgi:hypothetical protein
MHCSICNCIKFTFRISCLSRLPDFSTVHCAFIFAGSAHLLFLLNYTFSPAYPNLHFLIVLIICKKKH